MSGANESRSLLPPPEPPAPTPPAGTPDDEPPRGVASPQSVVAASAGVVAGASRIARFRGRAMLELTHPYPHFVPLHREQFDRLAYPILGGVSRTRMSDVFAYLSNTAEDLTPFEDSILFGIIDPQVGTQFYSEEARTMLWDMQALEWVQDETLHSQAIWRSPYGVIKPGEPVPFVMSLAGGNQGLYDDIMQSLAPLVMARKPDGVIWWVGDGANGKSTLMDAIYKIFPGQLSSITVKRLVDARDTPSLNGTLANVVKESSEGRIEDTEIYKSIGTHENFRVHKFHSQDDVEIRGNLHHIFSANSIPSFNDKGWSARRRTFVVPFTQRFRSNPNFENETFTPEMFGQLIYEMTRYAVLLRKQGYRYKWSAVTLGAKAEYDADANNAEEYARELIADGIVGFDTFNPLKMDYENWCGENGYIALGLTNLRRALLACGFERRTISNTVDGKRVHRKLYSLPSVKEAEFEPVGMSRPGMYTTPGFMPHDNPQPVVPQFEPEPPTTTTTTTHKPILDGRW